MTRLTKDEIERSLRKVRGWKWIRKELKKTFRLEDFSASINFLNKVAKLAEEADHHPDILIQYDKVTLTLTTHDEGGLTRRDFRLAQKIDSIS